MPPSPDFRAGTGAGNARLVTVLALALLASIALGVVVVLPGLVEQSQEPPSTAPSPATVAADPLDGRPERETAEAPSARAEVNDRERRDAERLLGQVLRRQAHLESLDVAAWGGEDYERGRATLERGDAAFGEGNFVAAAQAYEQVLEGLLALEGSRHARHDAAVQRGRAALARYDATQAEAQFAIALAIDPDDEAARRGLARAASIADVAELLARGRAHEDAGELAEAGRAYAQAVDLDPEVAEARGALDRVRARMDEVAFRQSMSAALAAMERGKFEDAGKSLDAAAGLRPGSQAVADVRARLRTQRQSRVIAAHRRRAETLEAQENWGEAAAAYQAVLDIDPHVAFAVSGHTKATALERIHQRLELYVREPTRLASEGPLEDARAVARAARDVESKGPQLARKLEALNELIALAAAPVAVTLNSDGQTEVTVYRVGRLGRFATYRIMLRPGRYTVVGIRPGYRDVRRQFEVVAGDPPGPIDVRCEETI